MEGYMVYIWLGVVILAVVAEALTFQLVSIWFAAGGIAGIITSVAGAAPWTQVLVAAVVTLVLLLCTRPFVNKILKVRKVSTNADRYVDDIAVVIQEINNEQAVGQVKVKNSIWSARSTDGTVIPVNEKVKVKDIEGVKLMVERISLSE